MAPERFRRVLWLNPAGPAGLDLSPAVEGGLFAAMQADREACFAGLASAAPSLFEPASLVPGATPVFAPSSTEAQRALYHRVIDRTQDIGDGVWKGGAEHLTAASRDDGGLGASMARSGHEHLVLWGALDAWIPRDHVEATVSALPGAELRVIDGVGHSMNLEDPDGLAQIATEFFGA